MNKEVICKQSFPDTYPESEYSLAERWWTRPENWALSRVPDIL